MKTLVALFVALGLTVSVIKAQQADELGDVFVTVSSTIVWGPSSDNTTSTATLKLNGVNQVSINRSGTGNGSDTLPRAGFRLVPGTVYNLSMAVHNVPQSGRSLLGAVNAAFLATAPTGYTILFNKVTRANASVGFNTNTTDDLKTVQIQVVAPTGSLGLSAGMATALRPARRAWQLSLGTTLSGAEAGSLYFNIQDSSASLASAFTQAKLQNDVSSTDVQLVMDANNSSLLKQVIAPQVCIDISTESSTDIELKCYHPSQRSANVNGSGYYTFSGFPYAWYMVNPGTSDSSGVTINCDIRGTDSNSVFSAVARTMVTSLSRTGSNPNYTWTAQSWHTSDSGALTQTVRSRNGATETITQLDANGATVAATTRTYSTLSSGEEITAITNGTNTGTQETISYDFYEQDTNAASYGQIKTVSTSGGSWQGFEYNSIGQISVAHSPWLSTDVGVPANFPQHGGVQKSLTYAPDSYGVWSRPANNTTTANSTTVGQSITTYTDETPFSGISGHTGIKVVKAVSADSYSASGTLTTTTRFFAENVGVYDAGLNPNAVVGEDFYRGQVHSIEQSNGVKKSFIYQRGSWNGTAFTLSNNSGVDTGNASKISVITGTSSSSGTVTCPSEAGYPFDALYLVDGKSTKEVMIRNAYADVVRTELYAWVSGTWNLVNYTDYVSSFAHQLCSSAASNGAQYSASYDGERKASETDAAGITVSYTYDAADRILTATKSSGPTTTYGYEGGTLSTTVSAAGTGETIYTAKHFDDSGRLVTELPANTGQINHTYNIANRTHTVTNPDNKSYTEHYFADGQLSYVDGAAVVPEYYAYDITSSPGQLVTWVYSGADYRTNVGGANMSGNMNGRWRKSSQDWLGRTMHAERPGYSKSSQANYAEDNSYDSTTGLLTQTARTGLAPVLYSYDLLSQPFRSGLLLNGGSSLVLASADRISEQEQYFENYNGAWWLHKETRTYPTLNSGTAVVTALSRERLTGFSGTLQAESQTTDADGNTVIRTVNVTRSSSTATVTTTRPDLTGNQIETITNGLSTSLATADGLTFSTQYDPLTRAWKRIDSRNNNTTTVGYKYGTSLVQSMTDGANNQVSLVSYDTMGRKQWVADAASHYTRFAYNDRGQLTNQWGDASYPVAYDYDATYGDRVKLTTYRNAPSGDSPSWPAGTATANTTTWSYDGPTGLLYQKIDHNSQAVEFDYNVRGQTTTRKWARTTVNSGQRLTSTYAYDDGKTGELTGITYNDTSDPIPTSPVGFTYTRIGQLNAVSDVTGTRSFNYQASAPWRLDNETLDASFYASRVIKRNYDTQTSASGAGFGGYTSGTLAGRYNGFDLGIAGNNARDQHIGYTLSNLGRFAGVTTRIASGASSDYVYSYAANSALLSGYAVGSNFAVSYAYESNRDLRTGIQAQWGAGNVLASHAYTYNSLGQRQTSLLGGSAFADYWQGLTYSHVFNTYSYNARGEMETSAMYRGDTPSAAPSSGDELPGRRFEFRYDSIGNRVTAGETGTPSTDEVYTTNNLNQYTAKDNDTVRVLGTASAASHVAVRGASATGKLDRAWGADLVPDNTTHASAGTASVYAAAPGGGSGGLDLTRSDSKAYFIPAAAQTFTYDADGNMTGDGVWDYTYDAENRLVRAASTLASIQNGHANQSLEFKYDYLGRRVQKRSLDQTASTDVYRRFVYDGWNVVAETDQGGTLQRLFTWGLDVAGSLSATGGVGALLQITDLAAGKTLAVVSDGNGNVSSLVNLATGLVEAAYEYGPFGELLRADGAYAKSNPFRFSSKWQDDETGLVYFGQRYYSPSMGRFINRDPIAESGGLNLYGFCENDGVNRTDYLGYSWLSKLFRKLSAAVHKVSRALTPFRFLRTWDRKIEAWENKHQRELKIAAAIVASIVTYGAASSWALGAMSTTTAGITTYSIAGTAISAGTASVLSAAAGGFAAGAVSGTIMGQSPSAVIKGALVSAAVAATFYRIGQLSMENTPRGFGVSATDGAVSPPVDITKSINVGTVYNTSAETNALVFDGTVKLESFVVYSSRELGYIGGKDVIQGLAARGIIAALDIDTLKKGVDVAKAVDRAAGGDRKFKNIVLDRHGGIDGSGDARMMAYYDPSSPLMNALASHLDKGGSVWLDWCFGGSFVATHPDYLAQVSGLFGGATVYYGTGIQQTFNYGLTSVVAIGETTAQTNRYLDFQSYSPTH